MSLRQVICVRRPLSGRVRAVPSKSVTHRALVVAALASGPSRILMPLVADDTRITREALVSLGIDARPDGDDAWMVNGRGGVVPGGGHLQLGDSGTSLRFLLAVASLGESPSHLDGSPRLRERPVEELAEALCGMGADVHLAPEGGGLPLHVGGTAPRGGPITLSAERSSQFASALLLIGSRLAAGIELRLQPPAVSLPYVALTAEVLTAFGVDIERPDELRWRVRPGDYSGRVYAVEGDHSAASYFLAAVAVVGGTVRVDGLRPDSHQPDARMGKILEQLGCRVWHEGGALVVEGSRRVRPFDLDMSDAPDLVPTLAVLGLFADGPCVVRGIAHLRLKESDRLGLLAANLRALGRPASATEDQLEIGAAAGELHGGVIATASDHRMAMAFAVAGLRIEGVQLDDAACVRKSNPGFWDQLESLSS